MRGVPEKFETRLGSYRYPSVYSSENFKDWVEWNFVRDIKNREIKYSSFPAFEIQEEHLRKIVSAVLEMKWENLCRGKGREAKKNRMLAIRCYRHFLRYDYENLSRIFGKIHPSSISRAVNKDLGGLREVWSVLEWEVQNAKRKT